VKVRFIRWALRQIDEILDYIEARSQGAENVKRRLGAVIDLLADHPDAGRRVANKADLRRVVATPYPYVIFYRSDAAGIVIHGVRHAARRSL
jgi:toxin ParE1/3/4